MENEELEHFLNDRNNQAHCLQLIIHFYLVMRGVSQTGGCVYSLHDQHSLGPKCTTEQRKERYNNPDKLCNALLFCVEVI